MFGLRIPVSQRPAAARWSMPESYPLPAEVFVQLRAEHMGLSEIVSKLLRCRELGIRVVAQVIDGRVSRLWAHPGEPTDFVECDPAEARPVAGALERLIDGLARARAVPSAACSSGSSSLHVR
jgi:hypothetical protein